MPRGFFVFASGLWYPAALGASIAWWLQAITTRGVDSAAGPSFWAFAFGLWFIIYHATWFTFLLSVSPSTPEHYVLRHFLSDILDGVALLAAFASMGFPSAQYRLLDHGWLFVAAALIPISALVGNADPHKWRAWVLTLAAVGVAGIGAVAGWGTVSDVHGCGEVVLLLLLYVLLGIYLAFPKLFGSQRG